MELVSSTAPAKRRRTSKYPFASLQIGESFQASGIKRTTMSTYACAYIRRHASLSGRKFETKENGDGSVVVTRVK